MDKQTSKPAVAPGADKPAVAPTATQRVIEYADRLRKSLAIISEKSPSSARVILDSYFPMIAPSRRLQADQFFPRTVRRHPRSDERSTEYGNKFLVLFFHVGNAILSYYDAYCDVGHADFEATATVLGDRVRLLEVIARESIDAFTIDGSDATGFALIQKPHVQKEQPQFRGQP